MEKDSGKALSELAVDGGMSNSDLTMQVCSILAWPSLNFKRAEKEGEENKEYYDTNRHFFRLRQISYLYLYIAHKCAKQRL